MAPSGKPSSRYRNLAAPKTIEGAANLTRPDATDIESVVCHARVRGLTVADCDDAHVNPLVTQRLQQTPASEDFVVRMG